MQDRELDALREAIAALQACRSALGDRLVDSALAPLLDRLTALHAAEPLGAPVRRLRQVSVLFLDIVGSTQLIQHLEPEDVQLVVDGALAAFTGLVRPMTRIPATSNLVKLNS
jgi:class 3 adenylate cyclase